MSDLRPHILKMSLDHSGSPGLNQGDEIDRSRLPAALALCRVAAVRERRSKQEDLLGRVCKSAWFVSVFGESFRGGSVWWVVVGVWKGWEDGGPADWDPGDGGVLPDDVRGAG